MSTRQKSKAFMEMIKASGRAYAADSRTEAGKQYARYVELGGVYADEKGTPVDEIYVLRKRLLSLLIKMRDAMRVDDEAAAVLDAVNSDIARLAKITGAGRQQSPDELRAKARERMRVRRAAGGEPPVT